MRSDTTDCLQKESYEDFVTRVKEQTGVSLDDIPRGVANDILDHPVICKFGTSSWGRDSTRGRR